MERFTHTVNPDQVGKKVNGPVLALERADMTIVVDDRMPGTRLAMLSLYAGAEKAVALRKLLEAKDAAVRAALPPPQEQSKAA